MAARLLVEATSCPAATALAVTATVAVFDARLRSCARIRELENQAQQEKITRWTEHASEAEADASQAWFWAYMGAGVATALVGVTAVLALTR